MKARIRRLDERNYVIEKFEPVEQKDGSSRREWRIRGFYGSLYSLLGDREVTLPKSMGRDDLLAAIDRGTERLWSALEEAIENGSLVFDADAAHKHRLEALKRIRTHGPIPEIEPKKSDEMSDQAEVESA